MTVLVLMLPSILSRARRAFRAGCAALPALACALMLPLAALAQTQSPGSGPGCAAAASADCYFSFQPAGSGGRFHYYASRAPAEAGGAPTAALIALHGHPRDANKTFDAALKAVTQAGAADRVLVVAPVFQVGAAQARRCRTAGVPPAQAGDLLWTCASWLEGGAAVGGGLNAFAAMDALVAELVRQWPGLRTVTIAGFSAGAQMVQHYIAFAAPAVAGGPALRYVVADPGTWLYFDPVRPQPVRAGADVAWSQCRGAGLGDCTLDFRPSDTAACPAVDRWKYGTQALPPHLSGTDPHRRYAAADISYLQGERDSSDAPGTFYKILDKSCAAQAQGPYRLQRGLAYAAYDRQLLAPDRPRQVVVVPGCAHDVACVFASPAARAALLGPNF